MPTIPLPRMPEVQRADYQGAAPADQTAKYQGQAALAGGIADVGSAVRQFAVKSAELKDDGDRAKIRLAMEKAQADVQRDLEATADHDRWESLADSRLREAEGEIFVSEGSAGFSPRVREEALQQWKAFSQDTTLRVRNQAQRASNEDAHRSMAALATLEYNRGDYGAGDGMIDQLEARGMITSNEAGIQKIVGRQRAEEEQAKALILEDAKGAVSALEDSERWPALTKSDRLSLRKTAQIEAGKQRAELVQVLTDRQDSGEVLKESELDALVESGDLLPTQRRWMLQQQSRLIPDEEVYERATGLMERINELDLNQPNGQVEKWKLEEEAALFPSFIKADLQGRIREKENPGGNAANYREGVSYARRLWSRNYLGNVQSLTKADVERLGGGRAGDPVSAKEFNQANLKLFNMLDALQHWSRKNPDASALEIKAFVDSMVAPDRAAAGANGVLNVTGKKTK